MDHAAELVEHAEIELATFGLSQIEVVRIEEEDDDLPTAVLRHRESGRILCNLYGWSVPSRELANFLYGLLGDRYTCEHQGFVLTEESLGPQYFRLGVETAKLLFPQTPLGESKNLQERGPN